MFINFKNKIYQQKKSINIMKDFVEGRINTIEFWNILMNNKVIKEILRKNKDLFFFKQYFDNNLDKIDISKLKVRIEIFWMIQHFFKTKKYKVIPYNSEEKLYMFISDIQPEWLNIEDDDLLLNIVNSAPNDLNIEKKTKWCKLKIQEFFKYDKYPPDWKQVPEWPIINGKPLVFKFQEEVDESLTRYFFYNPFNNDELIIEQYE